MQEEKKGDQMQNKHVEWNARFKELLDYRSEHGDCDVPVTQGKLGQWVRSQRRAYRAESLAQDRIDRLSSIGFKWKQKGPNVPWETRFDELVQYKAKHGDCDVPTKQGKLGTWVGTQRGAYRDDKLEQGCIDRLNSIGFKWRVVKEKVPWDTQFKELVQYKAKHGDCKVSDRQGPLGRWVRHQRESYKKNRLSQDSIDRLNGIGFDWTPPRGPRKKSALPGSRIQLLLTKEKVPITNVESLSTGARAMVVEPDKVEGEGFDSEPSLPLQSSSKSNHNPGTESEDEDDEIGAMIYDHLMQRRQSAR